MDQKEDRILDILEGADWEGIYRKLTFFAIWRCRKYSWNSGDALILPGGKTPEDIAAEAIEKIWQGKRSWDSEKYPNLLTHLKWVVASDINHLFESTEQEITARLPEWAENEPEQVAADDPVGTVKSSSILDPEAALIQAEKKAFEEEVKKTLYGLVEGDDELEMLLLCFEEGIDKPELISKETGWSVTQANNAKKRLFRKARSIRSILQNRDM